MNNIQIFKNNEFGEVRTLIIENEPWFVGKDIAEILEYRNGSRDINRHVDEEDKRKMMLFDGKQNKETTIINESGLYSLILSSKMPSAKKFKRWVTSELLPSVRKSGSCKPLSPQEMMRIQLGMIDDHEDRIKSLESNMVIDYGQQQTLRQHVNKAVLNALGGKDTEAYAYISKVVFAECNRDLQDRFKVNSRNNIPRKRYEEAIDYVDNWEPKTNTKLRIDEYNRQQRFEV
jgi:prophage antirepressor-like protein